MKLLLAWNEGYGLGTHLCSQLIEFGL